MKAIPLLCVLVLAACSGGTGASDESSASANPSVAPSAEEAAQSLCAVARESCEIEAGTYSTAPFQSAFTFTIDQTWTNDRRYVDGGGISLPLGGIYWATDLPGGQIGDEQVDIGSMADDFLAHVTRLAELGMTVTEPVPVTVDGVEGQSVDVTTGVYHAPGLYYLADDAFNLIPDEVARFIVLMVDGRTVILVVDSFSIAGFDAWLETAQPVIDSIRWE